jgi:hypothetical protein
LRLIRPASLETIVVELALLIDGVDAVAVQTIPVTSKPKKSAPSMRPRS